MKTCKKRVTLHPQNKKIMADGYLESRYDEVFGAKGKKVVVKRISIDSLLERNRSYRGFRKDYVVSKEIVPSGNVMSRHTYGNSS